MWAWVASLAVAFHTTPEYILHEVSYANLILYSATMVSEDGDKDEAREEEVIDGDDPRSREKLEDILASFREID